MQILEYSRCSAFKGACVAEFGRGDEVESTVRWCNESVREAKVYPSTPLRTIFISLAFGRSRFSGSMAAKAVERTHSGGGTDPAAETVSLTFGEEVGCE